MTEINQLARAKLALKQSPPLIIQCWMDEEWQECMTTVADDVFQHRVHPDDEEKLDAIIWESADSEAYIRAYAVGVGGFIQYLPDNSEAPEHWQLIATRELPANELKRCPQCNSDDIKFCNISVRPYCSTCKHWGAINYGSKADAIKEWNTREDDCDDKSNDFGIAKFIAESNEEAELFEDCKRMLTELNKALDDGANVKVFSGCAYHEDIKALLERINPKPVCKCCGQIIGENNA